ncbi:tripartite-type tricarboxylate transporter receptor subunit TctC [Bradyrhizobium elkanii]|nr:tripartite-type tricarboxylate transporter receptor subunit TctC [Bradyrhizobium elkanii]MCS3519829.1 tripartite-type tricarboxylate transporter receptor subunit TctC [Bradyrhizobium elkanii]MCS4067484.1 tripartite-type tricarboxylate transporter receptor subunit TctC [Bradyrhizobium elkanii]MCS4083020.1 tripartite-type tricarboxylate transporter receptor subunit TctC [Bradyrhizobium elkanii]MCS4105860.1 tripartite-type tricarboxylate transporter receptor subunit TctC [Bradyrhizobium elkanii
MTGTIIANTEQDAAAIERGHKGEIEMSHRNRLMVLLAAAGMLVSTAAQAQDYPTKPITLIVPWPAGGSTDISMRAIAESASKVLGQPIAVDNKAGGGGTVGPATMAAGAKPDGYTIAQIPITVFRLPLMQEVSWDPAKDFSYIIHLTGYTFGVTTNAESQFKTWQDVVDFAKKNPGKVTYATPGTGTSLHIGMEQIALMAGIKLTQVPFKGGAETNAAVLGQHTMLQADSTGWRPLVDAGKLRLLMVWTGARSPNYPDVPTLKELGYPMVYDSPFGIAGPKGMDPKIVAKLHDAFKKAIEDPAVIATLAKYDMVPNYKNTEDYRKFVGEVTESERKVIDTLGLAKK